MEIFTRLFNSTPRQVKHLLERLYQDYHAMGLLPGVRFSKFQTMAKERCEMVLLQEFAEAWEEGETESVRCDLLGRAFGIHQDWRYDPESVSVHVNDCLRNENRTFSRKDLETETVEVEGRTYGVTTSRLSLAGNANLVWRHSLLPGLMAGVNRLLELGDMSGRFIGLRTSGDYYVYAYAVPDAVFKIRKSGMLHPHNESDPTAALIQISSD